MRAENPPSGDDGAVWSHMRRLVSGIVQATGRGSFLDDGLDALVELLHADRGLVLLFHEDGAMQAINARGKGRALDPFERDEISRTIVDRVRTHDECVLLRPLDESMASESVHAFGIVAALAAPIRPIAWGDAGRRGVLYVDFRSARRAVGEPERQLVEAVANVMAAVLGPSEQLAIAREELRSLAARREAAGPTLDELLRPESMAVVRAELASCLRSERPILITGESGTGKTELAHAIAEASGRLPVVRAVLGSSDDMNTITSELFGHEKGAFSGAFARRTGLVEFARGGTLILDEILNLPPHAQQILLDFTQFGTYRPLGHEKAEPKRASVRIIAATNGDLAGAMARGSFRSDLYYRIAGLTLALGPLRARREDIPALAEAILRRIDRARPWRLSARLRLLLMSPAVAWPGNVRQLEAVIGRARERALLHAPDATTLTPEHVQPKDLGAADLDVPAARSVSASKAEARASFQVELAELGDTWSRLQGQKEALDDAERKVIRAALERNGGVVASAARALGIGRTSLLSRMDTLRVSRPARARRS
jgi:DNA-binding NtrC family response regulator